MKFGSTVLFVDDVPAVLEFYNKAFGFETRFYDNEYQFGELDAGGVPLAIASHHSGELMMPDNFPKAGNGRPEGVEIAFYTAEVATAYAKAVNAGAAPLAEPRVMPWGQTVAYVKSIEGTVVGFCTPTDSE